jgi:hypothetical protein
LEWVDKGKKSNPPGWFVLKTDMVLLESRVLAAVVRIGLDIRG